jgi:hypothetical protein
MGCVSSVEYVDTTGDYPETHNLKGTATQLRRLFKRLDVMRQHCSKIQSVGETTVIYHDISLHEALDAFEVFRMLESRVADRIELPRSYLVQTMRCVTFRPYWHPVHDRMTGDIRAKHLEALMGRIDVLCGYIT